MFQSLKIKDAITLMVLLLVVGVIGYYYANSQARQQLWKKAYPIRAELSVRHITCSDNSPTWLADF